MTIEFTPTARPAVTRTVEKTPNPYLPIVEKLIAVKDTDNDALTFSHPFKTEDEQKALAKVLRLIRTAGTEKNVTVRVKQDVDKGKATVTVWAVDKISRKRDAKPANEAAAEK